MKTLDVIAKEEWDSITGNANRKFHELQKKTSIKIAQFRYIIDLMDKNWETYSTLIKKQDSEEKHTRKVYDLIKNSIKTIEREYDPCKDGIITRYCDDELVKLGWTKRSKKIKNKGPMKDLVIYINEKVTPLGWEVVDGYRKASGQKPIDRTPAYIKSCK